MQRGNLSRRGFLAKSLGAMTAAGLPIWFANEMLVDAQEKDAKKEKTGANDRIVMGAIGAVPSYFALIYRTKTKLDDSLDVVAAHGLGGTVGALLTGVFAQKSLNGIADGLLFGNPLIGAAIGAAIPPVWCIAVVCFVQALEIVFKGQWG